MISHSAKFDRIVTEVALVGDFAQQVQVIDDAEEKNAAEVKAAEDRENAAAATEKLFKGVVNGIANLELQTDSVVKDLRLLSVRLASMMLRKVMGTSESDTQERLEQLINDAFSRPEPAVGIHVHHQDYAAVKAFLAKTSNKVVVTPDQSVPSGECRIVFDTYELISDIEHQLNEIEHRLQEVVNDA